MERPEPSTSPAPSHRGLILIGAGIATLVLATAVVVVVFGGSGEPEFEPGSPQSALYDYLKAYEEGDLEGAHGHFSADVRAAWPLDDYENAVDSYAGELGQESARRVLFDRSAVDGDVAQVHLTVEEFYGDGLSGDTFRSPRVVRMVREDGSWRVDEHLIGLDPAPAPIR